MRRLPTKIKALRGTLRRDRVNVREPKPAVGVPHARRLQARVRVEYRRLQTILAPLGIATIADAHALELAAHALAEYRTAVDVLLRSGQSYQCTTSAGAVMHRARPEQAIAADAWRRAMHALEQFGLTPVSRSKVESLPEALAAVANTRLSEVHRPRDGQSPVGDIDAWQATRTGRASANDPGRFFR